MKVGFNPLVSGVYNSKNQRKSSSKQAYMQAPMQNQGKATSFKAVDRIYLNSARDYYHTFGALDSNWLVTFMYSALDTKHINPIDALDTLRAVKRFTRPNSEARETCQNFENAFAEFVDNEYMK